MAKKKKMRVVLVAEAEVSSIGELRDLVDRWRDTSQPYDNFGISCFTPSRHPGTENYVSDKLLEDLIEGE